MTTSLEPLPDIAALFSLSVPALKALKQTAKAEQKDLRRRQRSLSMARYLIWLLFPKAFPVYFQENKSIQSKIDSIDKVIREKRGGLLSLEVAALLSVFYLFFGLQLIIDATPPFNNPKCVNVVYCRDYTFERFYIILARQSILALIMLGLSFCTLRQHQKFPKTYRNILILMVLALILGGNLAVAWLKSYGLDPLTNYRL